MSNNPLQQLPLVQQLVLTARDRSLLTLEVLARREVLEARQHVLDQEFKELAEMSYIMELDVVARNCSS
jgi:hypothetical protein